MSLLSEKTLSFLRKTCQFSRWFHFHPFLWNEEEKCPEVITSGSRLLPWHFCAGTTFLYYTFVIVRAIQTSLDDTAGTGTKIYIHGIQPGLLHVSCGFPMEPADGKCQFWSLC